MRSIVNVVTAAASPMLLTTLARVKSELNIKNKDSDDILTAKIAEASSDIELAMGYRLPSEQVTQTFWHDDAMFHAPIWRQRFETPAQTTLFLSRTPVSAIASVTVDDTVLDPSEYKIDGDTGLLDRFSTDGYPCAWGFCKSVVAAYTGGFVLPGNSGRNLLYSIEGAVVALVCEYWASRGRDPTLRGRTIPGVLEEQFWVGAVGDPGLLPARVLASLPSRPLYSVA